MTTQTELTELESLRSDNARLREALERAEAERDEAEGAVLGAAMELDRAARCAISANERDIITERAAYYREHVHRDMEKRSAHKLKLAGYSCAGVSGKLVSP